MLRSFFEMGRDPSYFEGLKIMGAGEKYTSRMGQYPVIFLTLKDARRKVFEREINKLLAPSISYLDNQKSFYHGFMVGILLESEYLIKSNRESGDGRSDILLTTGEVFEHAFVIELKAVKQEGTKPVTMVRMDEAAEAALKQIDDRRYTDALLEQGFGVIGRYGISFFRKRCRVHYKEGYVE